MPKIWDWAKDNSLAVTTLLQISGFALVMLQIHQATQRDIKVEKNMYHDHLKMINQILLQEDKLREKFNLTESDIIGYLMLNDYEKMYNMRCDRLFKKDEHWHALEILIYKQLRQNGGPYHKFWQERKGDYPTSFQKFVNTLISNNNEPTHMVRYEYCY